MIERRMKFYHLLAGALGVLFFVVVLLLPGASDTTLHAAPITLHTETPQTPPAANFKHREVHFWEEIEARYKTVSADPTPTSELAESSSEVESVSHTHTPDTSIDPATEVSPNTTNDVAVPQTSTFESEVITQVLKLTNEVREKHGLAPLTLQDTLTETANEKATDMATHNYFEHSDKSGCDVTCLLSSTDLRATTWGENLMHYPFIQHPSPETLAAETVEGWIESSTHRDNILRDEYTHVGIAVAKGSRKDYYVVAHYAALK